MNDEQQPHPLSFLLATPFNTKWTLIISTAAFLASSLLAAIDDDPPQLVVWAGTIQFVIVVVVAIAQAKWGKPASETPAAEDPPEALESAAEHDTVSEVETHR